MSTDSQPPPPAWRDSYWHPCYVQVAAPGALLRPGLPNGTMALKPWSHSMTERTSAMASASLRGDAHLPGPGVPLHVLLSIAPVRGAHMVGMCAVVLAGMGISPLQARTGDGILGAGMAKFPIHARTAGAGLEFAEWGLVNPQFRQEWL